MDEWNVVSRKRGAGRRLAAPYLNSASAHHPRSSAAAGKVVAEEVAGAAVFDDFGIVDNEEEEEKLLGRVRRAIVKVKQSSFCERFMKQMDELQVVEGLVRAGKAAAASGADPFLVDEVRPEFVTGARVHPLQVDGIEPHPFLVDGVRAEFVTGTRVHPLQVDWIEPHPFLVDGVRAEFVTGARSHQFQVDGVEPHPFLVDGVRAEFVAGAKSHQFQVDGVEAHPFQVDGVRAEFGTGARAHPFLVDGVGAEFVKGARVHPFQVDGVEADPFLVDGVRAEFVTGARAHPFQVNGVEPHPFQVNGVEPHPFQVNGVEPHPFLVDGVRAEFVTGAGADPFLVDGVGAEFVTGARAHPFQVDGVRAEAFTGAGAGPFLIDGVRAEVVTGAGGEAEGRGGKEKRRGEKFVLEMGKEGDEKGTDDRVDCKVEMVLYGVGSIYTAEIARCQLALALLIKQKYSLIGPLLVYDPITTPIECRVMRTLGCVPLETNDFGRRPINGPTLFYMPHNEVELYDSVVQTSLDPFKLNQIVIIGNSFRTYSERWTTYPLPDGDIPLYLLKVREYVEEIPVDDDFYPSAFNDTSWHLFFHVEARQHEGGLSPLTSITLSG